MTDTGRDDGDGINRAVEFDWAETESVPMTVVELVADVRGVDETELERLTDRIDPDALDRLFTPKDQSTPRPRGSVTFPFADTDVTVYAHGEIVVRYE